MSARADLALVRAILATDVLIRGDTAWAVAAVCDHLERLLEATEVITETDYCPLNGDAPVPRPTGAELIAAERARQQADKGYTPEHDDAHGDGSLLAAGILLACDVAGLELAGVDPPNLGDPWPDVLCLHVREKHAGDEVRRLTIAGAMIAAEIDRLNRRPVPSASAAA